MHGLIFIEIVRGPLFVVFPDSTQIAEMIPTYKTHYTNLNSHYVSKLCSCLVILEKNHLKINKKKKNHVYRGVYCLFDWSLKNIVQKHMVTALIASCSSVNILQTHFYVLC